MRNFKRLKVEGMTLEEAFFLEQDKILVEKLKQLESMKETKEELARVSGIKNDVVLDKLVEMGISPEIMAALSVVPLIEVAWADGHVDLKERIAVMKCAESMGIHKDNVEYTLIERWLDHRPGIELLDAWTHYIEGLCLEFNSSEVDALKSELMRHTETVAQASGGIFGFGEKVSDEEKRVILELSAAFKK